MEKPMERYLIAVRPTTVPRRRHFTETEEDDLHYGDRHLIVGLQDRGGQTLGTSTLRKDESL